MPQGYPAVLVPSPGSAAMDEVEFEVDIWNVGIMVCKAQYSTFHHYPAGSLKDYQRVWDLFQNKHMFEACEANKGNSKLHHTAEVVAC